MQEKDNRSSGSRGESRQKPDGNGKGFEGGTFDINTDSDVSGDAYLNEPLEEESGSEKYRAELEELKEKYLRLVAEFDNFRKRTAREKIETIQTASKEVIVSLLDVLDDADRAQAQIEKSSDIEQIKAGISLVFSKLRNTLQSKGLKPMESKGKNFDPDIHEAITEVEASPEMKGKVVDEVQKGYYLGDKIIRFAKVVVGR